MSTYPHVLLDTYSASRARAIDAMREWFEAGPMIGFANQSPLGVEDMEIMLRGGGAGYGMFYLPAKEVRS